MSRRNTESLIQSRFIAWADGIIPQLRPDICIEIDGRLRAPFYAVPNGGARHAVTGAILKREGVRRGVPDVMCDVPGGQGYSGLALEFKAPKGVMSREQIAWRTHLKSCCNRQHAICKTASEAIAIATDYLGLDAWKAREK